MNSQEVEKAIDFATMGTIILILLSVILSLVGLGL